MKPSADGFERDPAVPSPARDEVAAVGRFFRVAFAVYGDVEIDEAAEIVFRQRLLGPQILA